MIGTGKHISITELLRREACILTLIRFLFRECWIYILYRRSFRTISCHVWCLRSSVLCLECLHDGSRLSVKIWLFWRHFAQEETYNHRTILTFWSSQNHCKYRSKIWPSETPYISVSSKAQILFWTFALFYISRISVLKYAKHLKIHRACHEA